MIKMITFGGSFFVIRYEIGVKIFEFLDEFVSLLVYGIVGVQLVQSVPEFLQSLNISSFDHICNFFHLLDL